jgi:hypothetical protein
VASPRFSKLDVDELRYLDFAMSATRGNRGTREIALHEELQIELREREEDERLDAETLIGENAT